MVIYRLLTLCISVVHMFTTIRCQSLSRKEVKCCYISGEQDDKKIKGVKNSLYSLVYFMIEMILNCADLYLLFTSKLSNHLAIILASWYNRSATVQISRYVYELI